MELITWFNNQSQIVLDVHIGKLYPEQQHLNFRHYGESRNLFKTWKGKGY